MSTEKFSATVMNPVAKVETEAAITPAARLTCLEGKKIALWWNGKSKGNVALNTIAERLKKDYNAETVFFKQDLFHSEEAFAAVADTGCAAVVAATADCGSSAVTLTRDLCALEKMGVPAVMLIAKPFLLISNAELRLKGLFKVSRAVMEHPLNSLPEEEAAQVADALYDAVVKGLTQDGEALDTPEAEAARPIEEKAEPERITIEGENYFDFSTNLNRYFINHGWSDGLPLVPQTEAAVNRMLSGTIRGRDEVLLKYQPGNGVATIEKIAVNCVMAGCEPSHLPVVAAAIEAMHKDGFNITSLTQSSGADTPMVMVNGPIAKEIGMTAEGACLGPGKYSAVNTAIGRAVRLTMMNIGHCYPSIRDIDTLGSPNKYALCACENEDDNPFNEPYNVEKGFKPGTNCVTTMPCQSFMDVEDLESGRPEDLLMTIACTIDTMGWPGARSWMGFIDPNVMHVTVIFAPDHARLITNSGWTKFDVRQYLYAKCRRAWGQFKHLVIPRIKDGTVHPGYRWLATASDDTEVPMVRDPSYFDIAVIGGAAGKSALSMNIGCPTTVEIKE